MSFSYRRYRKHAAVRRVSSRRDASHNFLSQRCPLPFHQPESFMPKKEIKHPDKEKSTGAYSAAVEIDGWIYVSGQGPLDVKTARPVRGTIEEETQLTLTH